MGKIACKRCKHIITDRERAESGRCFNCGEDYASPSLMEKTEPVAEVPCSDRVSLRAEFLKKFPKQTTLDYRCYIEITEGQSDCVWDTGKPHECCEADTGTKKEDCEYWQQKDIAARYKAEELWEWIDKKLAS